MNNEKISIIVPCYNIENLIERTVESICNQTYSNLEIILVDDGSKDSTLDVLNRLSLKDTRIKVVQKENGGVTSARLAGVSVATGEWIGFVDGDDWIEPDMYEHLLRNALESGADISHCGYQMVFPSRVDYYYNTGKKVILDNNTGLSELLSGNYIEPGLVIKLFHKHLFDELLQKNLMDYSIKNLEDLLMNFYLFRQAEFSIYEDFCPYYYMVRKNSAATSEINKNQLADPIKVFKTILKEIEHEDKLLDIVNQRLLAKYISNATLNSKNQKMLIKTYRCTAREYIKKNLRCILKGNYSKREKIMAIWVAICPGSYSFVHKMYSNIKGTNHKYDVD